MILSSWLAKQLKTSKDELPEFVIKHHNYSFLQMLLLNYLHEPCYGSNLKGRILIQDVSETHIKRFQLNAYLIHNLCFAISLGVYYE
ncbi:CLUMA_CG014758, isoform A [Clunio marinus]|uniref:CLUMA_CG014758, isoform A n=1 Tax=Clunio marinus TaxID=568069 RepID=A0A1J1ILP2_9DIPT|nr:CLUMA_CG014758, isoform A [Clunio marinus]